MRRHDTNERARILASHGVSEAEDEAMSGPHYEVPFALERLARWTAMTQGGASPVRGRRRRSVAEYRAALEGMLEKGWLQRETAASRRELAELRQEGIPMAESPAPAAGSVTFTREGYLLHRRLLLALRGRRLAQDIDSFYDVHAARRAVDFFAGSESACRRWAHRIQQASCVANLSALVNGPAEVLAIEDPRPIGLWRPSRHLLLRSGWHVRVRYRKLRPRRMDFPELDVRAVAEGLRPIHIHGTVGHLELSLGDHPYWLLPARRTDDATASWRWSFQLLRSRKAERREGRWVPAPRLFELEEPPGNRRRSPLTLREARRILRECVEAYRAPSR